MELIKWRDEFCTGIAGVDYEHENLINQINAIYHLIDEQADAQTVVDHLGDIYGNISAHFALEEQMMKRHGYDDYQLHMADHNRLLDDIVDITEEFENSSQLNDSLFKQKLNDWFQNHFKTHDSRLHKLEKLIAHDQVEQSIMNAIIGKAKSVFYSRKKAPDSRP